MRPNELISHFDAYLAARKLQLEAVVIGGAALNLLGVIARPTRDCDILHPALPPAIVSAARDFAAATRAQGESLDDDWLNNGPSSLTRVLPPGWQARLVVVFTGTAILLRCLGRADLLRSKLFALCDRGLDLPDCLALAPSADELTALQPWVSEQDLNPEWPAHVSETLADLGGGWAMAFSRAIAPVALAGPDAVTSAMVGIGMGFAAPAIRDANIEDTLLFASIEAMGGDDLRVLSVLATWFGVHAPWVNADRLTRLVSSAAPRVRALWAALARWQASDRRFARLARIHGGPRVDVLANGTDFQIKRHGEDARFAGSALRAPANLLRDRPADVLDSAALARRHRAYHYRVMMGPSYRADMWATLESTPALSAAALARTTYGSFATAWHVRRDFALLAPRARRT